MSEDNIDTLLESLSSFDFKNITPKETNKKVSGLADEDVNQFILNKSKELIETGVSAVQDLMPYVQQGQNPDEIDALANLMSATTKAIEALNKTNLIDRKADRDEKIKKMEIEARKELAQAQGNKTINHNTNVLIASREEIMKKLLGVDTAEVLEIENK